MTYPDGSVEKYTYDAVGNLATYTARAGQVKTSTYDNQANSLYDFIFVLRYLHALFQSCLLLGG